MISEAIYAGKVVHRRLRPAPHRLEYSVFSLLADIDRLPDLGRRLWLFSHNRFNLFSVHERDHGTGNDLKQHLLKCTEEALGVHDVQRFLMLCYPRVFGYVFNPLTVYYGLDGQGRTAIVIYEVSNTFGERHTYALSAQEADDGVIRQDSVKVFHVSPFNKVEGRYSFRTRLPGDDASVGILLKDDGGPLVAAHFNGRFRSLSDGTLVKLFSAYGFMTAKVWLAIRYEALKLWAKRVPFFSKPPAPDTLLTTDRPRGRDMAA
ncbi:MAG: DUF1365 domain-containing protein [Pseudomonadota bacterium]